MARRKHVDRPVPAGIRRSARPFPGRAGKITGGGTGGGDDAGEDGGEDGGEDAGFDAGPPPAQLTFAIDAGTAGASGRIEWADGGGLLCDLAQSPCVMTFDAGTLLQLRGVPANTWDVLVGFSGCTAPVHGRCDLTVSSDATVTAQFDRANLAFVTSGLLPGGFARNPDGGANFEPIATANAFCAAHAADAGLPGTYLAFIGSTPTSYNPTGAANIGRARGWLRVDGKPAFDQLRNNAISNPLYPLVLTERGDPIPTGPAQPRVLTGMTTSGVSIHHCSNYTSMGPADLTVGAPSMGGQLWADLGWAHACFGTYRLACFGVDRQVPVRIDRAEPTRLVFVSSAWEVDGGVAEADALCDAEAAAVHQASGTFNAFLFRPPAADPRTRLNGLSSVPWARPDGVIVVPDVSTFLADAIDIAAPLTNQPGAYFWVGSSQNHCSSWTSASGAGNAVQRGRAFDSSANWDATDVNDGFMWCNDTTTRLACFQR